MFGSIDFASGCAWFLTFTVFAALVYWVVLGFRERPWKDIVDPDARVWECSICTHMYLSGTDKDLSICPLCNSYNKWPDSGL